MSKPFLETTRSLEADGHRRSLFMLVLAFFLLCAWLWWFARGRVAAWEVTHRATLEVSGKVYGMDTPLSGKVARHYLSVGREVNPGDPLLELESGRLRIQLADARDRLINFQDRLVATEKRGKAASAALERSLAETRNQLSKSRAELEQARAVTVIKEDIVARYTRLSEQQLISELDLLEARNALESARGDEKKVAYTLQLQQEQKSTTTHQLAVLEAEITEELTELRGSIAQSRAAVEELELELEEHTVRAPVAGTLGEVADLQVGTFLESGFRLCSIVPEGKPRVYAHFTPGVALGRIQEGQEARVRLDGFPWTRHGSLSARVSKVGTEPRDGLIQVDLDLEGKTPPTIPLQHGMPGSVEVRIGLFSPLELVLRAVGKFLQPGDNAA